MEQALRGLHPLRIARDVVLIATGGQADVERPLDPPQILVMSAEEGVKPLLGKGHLCHVGWILAVRNASDCCGSMSADGRLPQDGAARRVECSRDGPLLLLA